MMITLQVVLAILPCLLIMYLIYRMDLYEREDLFPLALCFLLGMLIVFPLYEIQQFFYDRGWSNTNTIPWALFSSLVVVALSEESFKYLALRIYPYRQSFFNEPIDGVVYAMMVGMGFAALENIFYAFQFEMTTTLIRGITAVPAHASFAVIMGYWLGKARFAKNGRLRYLFLAWAVPVGVHGLYNFFVLQEVYDWLIVFSVIILSVALFIAVRLVKQQQAESPFKVEEDAPPPESIEPIWPGDDLGA